MRFRRSFGHFLSKIKIETIDKTESNPKELTELTSLSRVLIGIKERRNFQGRLARARPERTESELRVETFVD